MIVKVTVPANVTQVRYGNATMIPDENYQLDVPAYVAKSLVTLPNVTCDNALAASAASLLAQSDDDFEGNYLLHAYGRPLPKAEFDQDNNVTNPTRTVDAAVALLAQRGEPVVSVS